MLISGNFHPSKFSPRITKLEIFKVFHPSVWKEWGRETLMDLTIDEIVLDIIWRQRRNSSDRILHASGCVVRPQLFTLYITITSTYWWEWGILWGLGFPASDVTASRSRKMASAEAFIVNWTLSHRDFSMCARLPFAHFTARIALHRLTGVPLGSHLGPLLFHNFALLTSRPLVEPPRVTGAGSYTDCVPQSLRGLSSGLWGSQELGHHW